MDIRHCVYLLGLLRALPELPHAHPHRETPQRRRRKFLIIIRISKRGPFRFRESDNGQLPSRHQRQRTIFEVNKKTKETTVEIVRQSSDPASVREPTAQLHREGSAGPVADRLPHGIHGHPDGIVFQRLQGVVMVYGILATAKRA